ncbi:MAG: hypothetical protein ABFQ53_02845 [Patescibacteria group bacterium]
MKYKKGAVNIGAIIFIVIILVVTFASMGYFFYKKSATDESSIATDVAKVDIDTEEVELDDKVGNDLPVVEDDGSGFGIENIGENPSNTSSPQGMMGSDISAQEQAVSDKVNIVLIFDATDSTKKETEFGASIDIAKKAMANYISNLGESAYLSILAFGHNGDNTEAGKTQACNGVEEIYYMGEVIDDVVIEKINSLEPKSKWAPIAQSLQEAANILQKKSAEDISNQIILVSDSQETCEGDPVATAEQLYENGVVVDVIGLNVEGEAAQQLIDIASVGGGMYFSVKNEADFENAFNGMKMRLNANNMQMQENNDNSFFAGDEEMQNTDMNTANTANNIEIIDAKEGQFIP